MKVFIVTDSTAQRHVVGEAVGAVPGPAIVGAALDPPTALARIERERPDVVIVGLSESRGAVGLVDALRGRYPALGVLTVRGPERGEVANEPALPVVRMVAKPARPEHQATSSVLLRALRCIDAWPTDAPAVATPRRAAPRFGPPTTGGPRPPTSGFGTGATSRPTLSRLDTWRSAPPAFTRPATLAPPPARPVRFGAPADLERPAAGATELPTRQLTGPRFDTLPNPVVRSRGRFALVAIGVSAGGPAALAQLVPGFAGNLPVPIVAVQHMPARFTGPLAERLSRASAIEVREAADGETLRAGVMYIAPGGRHLVVRREGRALVAALTDDPPVHACRPAVDVLFRSLAGVASGPVLTLVLTGMGGDGADGVAALSALGSYNLVQDEATSVVFGMPARVLERGLAHEVLPLSRIAARVNALVMGA